jgi:hypothetical protein
LRSSLPDGPTAIRRVVGRVIRRYPPIAAANINSPAAITRNGEVILFGLRRELPRELPRDRSAAPVEPSEEDMWLPSCTGPGGYSAQHSTVFGGPEAYYIRVQGPNEGFMAAAAGEALIVLLLLIS